MRTLLLVVHIVAAAAWFGHKLTVPRQIRTSIDAGPDQAGTMVVQMRGTARLGIGAALLTVATGVALLALAGWTATTVLGLGIMAALAAVAVGAVFARPAWRGLEAAVVDDDLATAGAFGRRFSRLLHVENLLWTAALWAMVAG
ncbi:MAG TPA: hypothetical protein VLB67_05485 [Acidimicrobiia bacterium]|nr:hypothetical protein [Acidimicrobiia bacterium]